MTEHTNSKIKGFFKTPNAVYDDESLDLSAYELIVLIYIYRLSNQKAEAWPGYSKIAKRCRISKTTARTAILNLEKKGFITVTRRSKNNKDNQTNLYKIKKLPVSCGDIGISRDDTAPISGDDIPVSCDDTNKELLKKNYSAKELKKNDIDQFFEKVWKLYPYKIGKGKIKLAQKNKLFELGYDTLSKCINRYKENKPDWQTWQHGSTFFNSGYIDYLDENYEGVKVNGSNRDVASRAERKDEAYYRRGYEGFYN